MASLESCKFVRILHILNTVADVEAVMAISFII